MSATMTVRLEDEIKEKLEKLASVTNRTKSFLASEAIKAFLELNEWQLKEIENALEEADAEDFASDKNIKNTLKKWHVDT